MVRGWFVRKGETFTYVFDFGDDWRHRCLVEGSNLDPTTTAGIVSKQPIPILGLGLYS